MFRTVLWQDQNLTLYGLTVHVATHQLTCQGLLTPSLDGLPPLAQSQQLARFRAIGQRTATSYAFDAQLTTFYPTQVVPGTRRYTLTLTVRGPLSRGDTVTDTTWDAVRAIEVG